MVSKKTATSSPFALLRDFLLATNASLEASDQEKADWIGAYVDQINPMVFAGLWRGRGSPPHPPAAMFKLTIFRNSLVHSELILVKIVSTG